ncbi:Serine/threonine protein kinase [Formivibrio citricus]|uniref:Serine/threonine protein kinase n=1 Tax=Formivibrio citricus TaxID=83765 RepID=A0A1I5BI56_9NEIS|nr:serine/threonine protein kinase [Formivibrio citricus]SFN74352.1 Serine/threonine protein kinase [Formivibrio citricus]
MAELGGGRFRIERNLGQGAQGSVFLAHDTRLDRKVAIKLLRPDQAPKSLDEARLVSKLQHPNVVALHDVFIESGRTGLVFEYVEGETLSEYLRREGAQTPVRAVELMLGILDGLASAHAQGIIHRDIKPQNIMIDSSGRPRIMDFGVATRNAGESGMTGTVGYMAPEMLKNMPVEAQADIFAAGMTLYQMLTGRLPVEGGSLFATLNRIANEKIAPPSSIRPGIDEQLDHLVMVALFKEPQERYANVSAMREALTDWLEAGKNEPAKEGAGGSRNSTLDFLLRRMSHTADFPALSQTISAINRINNSDSERLQSLSAAILKDFSLTNKLLRIVNSATYGQFGGAISTVSRAIVILGFDHIRNLAVTLLLFEHMRNKTQAEQLREASLKSFFGGLLASTLGKKSGWREVEELQICGMFHHLGKLLTLYYFHEESQQIAKRVEQTGEDEQVAAEAVLGISYQDLAVGVSGSWNFPERIVGSMRPMPEGPIRQPQSQIEKLRFFANLSGDLLPLIEQSPANADKFLAKVMGKYAKVVNWPARDYQGMIQEAADHYLHYLSILGVEQRGSSFCKRLRQTAGHAPAADEAGFATGDVGIEEALQAAEVQAEDSAPLDPAAILSAGVQDITNTLVSNFNLNDLLRMTLETMYRGIGFERVIFCTRDTKRPMMLARFGFGLDIQQITAKFSFDISQTNDVFQLALARNADVLIEDIDAESIKARIPSWYRAAVPAKTFIVFPVVLDKKPIGLFYGDRTQAHSLKIPPEQLNLLKTLRNQAILAIRQKQFGG